MQHISSVLDSLSAGWSVQIDSFNSETPRGPINFSNILAVLDPMAPRRLLLACHYDTKNIPSGTHEPQQVFVGASDSAVPCAMMLELVTALDSHLKMLKQQVSLVGLSCVKSYTVSRIFIEWCKKKQQKKTKHLLMKKNSGLS